ncbi:uncharacterized protein [Polyergus mexicanus]|uniref:uncharacterized protein n=1 Tax=Polyergus mexicanus TaxID=615972 RepID=UPI0038B4977C
MDKLQFEFTIVASPKDEKSNTIGITSIRTEDGLTYVLQGDHKYIANHTELMKTENHVKAKNSLKKRHQSRKVWISMTEELKKIYMDEDGNIQFADEYLQEIEEKDRADIRKDDLSKILEKLMETSQKKEGEKNLKQIADKYMIEKFTSKHSNAKQWIETFEKECTRFDIIEDEMKIEILRLFLDKSCSDWHCATLTKLTVTAKWREWKNKFLETFADKGWNTVTYALSFRYKEGSLIDYAMRKERLLLDMNKNMDTKTLTTLIAVGLPGFIMDKIDREECEDSTKLFNEIRRYESLVNKKNFLQKKEERLENKRKTGYKLSFLVHPTPN